MAGPQSTEQRGNGAALAGGAALGIAIAALLGKKAAAAVDDDTETNALLTQILETLGNLSPGGNGGGGVGSVEAITPSYRAAKSIRFDIAVANVGVQLPSLEAPPGVAIKIKAGWNNVGIIYVGGSAAEAASANQSEPLIRNEFTTYFVKDAGNLYVSGTVAGDWLTVTVEVP